MSEFFVFLKLFCVISSVYFSSHSWTLQLLKALFAKAEGNGVVMISISFN